jgi:putative ABC transport system substrate-binding protein
MRRREFNAMVGGLVATWPAAAWSQAARTRRIGVLSFASLGNLEGARTVFAKRLEDLGWTDGQNVQIDYRFADADHGKIVALAKELVSLNPDVLLAYNGPAVRALQQETRTIPIVFISVYDPVKSGFVANLARPGGNITGFANTEMVAGGKQIEILKAIVPGLTHVIFMFNPDSIGISPSYQHVLEEATRVRAIELILGPVRSEADIARVIADLGASPTRGLYVNGEPFLGNPHTRDLIISLCAKYRVPAVYVFRFFVISGGLISYGNDLLVGPNRHAAEYIDRILKGASPADLPVQLPTKQELVINLKTANALGISIPPLLLATADEVIE